MSDVLNVTRAFSLELSCFNLARKRRVTRSDPGEGPWSQQSEDPKDPRIRDHKRPQHIPNSHSPLPFFQSSFKNFEVQRAVLAQTIKTQDA